MSDYAQRKEYRTKLYEANRGWKKRTCSACAGSGRYDRAGSPACGACNGTGRERYKPVVVEEKK